MRAELKEYQAVEEAAMKFVKSVAEGNSKYAKELFTDEAVLFGYLDGKIIGAVTHVFVQDASSGYGIFIENMLKNTERLF